ASWADGPSRSRNTGRYVPDAVTMPTNTESTWTRVQLWARVEVLGWAGAMAATLPRSPPGGCPIPDDGARHARSNRPPDALHLRRLRRGVRARRDYGAARPAAAGPVRSFGDRPRRRGRRGRRGDRAPRTSPDARRDRCRPVGPGQPARAVPRRIRAPGRPRPPRGRGADRVGAGQCPVRARPRDPRRWPAARPPALLGGGQPSLRHRAPARRVGADHPV